MIMEKRYKKYGFALLCVFMILFSSESFTLAHKLMGISNSKENGKIGPTDLKDEISKLSTIDGLNEELEIENVNGLTPKASPFYNIINNDDFSSSGSSNSYNLADNDSIYVSDWNFISNDASPDPNIISGNYNLSGGNSGAAIECRIEGYLSSPNYHFNENDSCYWEQDITLPTEKVYDASLKFDILPEHIASIGGAYFFVLLDESILFIEPFSSIRDLGLSTWHSIEVNMAFWHNYSSIFTGTTCSAKLKIGLNYSATSAYSPFFTDIEYSQIWLDNIRFEIDTSAPERVYSKEENILQNSDFVLSGTSDGQNLGDDDSSYVSNWDFYRNDVNNPNTMSGNYRLNEGLQNHGIEVRIDGYDSGSMYEYHKGDHCYWEQISPYSDSDKILDAYITFDMKCISVCSNTWDDFFIDINNQRVYSDSLYAFCAESMNVWSSYKIPLTLWANSSNILTSSTYEFKIGINTTISCSYSSNFDYISNQQILLDNVELVFLTPLEGYDVILDELDFTISSTGNIYFNWNDVIGPGTQQMRCPVNA